MKRHRKVHLPDAHINVTSLLDITFVLLIAFMVVAPAVQQSAELKLPRARGGETPKKPAQVNLEVIDRDGSPIYRVDGQQVDVEEIVEAIRGSKEYNDEALVALRADRATAWEGVARAITQLKANGITNLAIVSEKER